MASPKHADFSDYEIMFKKHVHDNMLLNSDLRLLDEMKKSKLRELKRDTFAFKSRFSRYNKTKSVNSMPDVHYTGKTTPRAATKPSFVVCKTSPCSLKTWNNLTDITKGFDVYRTDILQTEEAELSFKKKADDNSNTKENVTGDSTKYGERKGGSTVQQRSHSSIQKPFHKVVNVESAEEASEDFHLPDFRARASTMPSYCYKTKGTSHIKKADNLISTRPSYEGKNESSENKTRPENSQSEENKKSSLSRPNISVIDCKSENAEKPSENELKVTFDLDEKVCLSSNQTTQAKKLNFKFQRAKSFVIHKDHGDLSTFRARSNTLDSAKSWSKDSSKLLVRRESLSLNRIDRAVRRMSMFDRLLSQTISSTENDSDTDWSSSFENIQSCRYLRVPGQNIDGSTEDLSLENINFGQES